MHEDSIESFLDDNIRRRFGEGDIDGLLAATAKVHRMTLVTRNTANIGNLSVPILNPFGLR